MIFQASNFQVFFLASTEVGHNAWNTVLTAAIATVFALLLNIVFLIFLPRLRRWNLTKQTSIKVDANHGHHLRCRISNNGFWTMHQTMVYIKLNYKTEDIVVPPDKQKAFITPEKPILLEDFDQLCWNVSAPNNINPMKVDIYAGEEQPMSPCQIINDNIAIASEQGWGADKKRRLFLKRQKYTGELKIVSDDTTGLLFHITIDPDNKPQLRIAKK